MNPTTYITSGRCESRAAATTYAQRVAFAKARTPEMLPDGDGVYSTCLGRATEPGVAWSVLITYGGSLTRRKPRNATIRAALRRQWPQTSWSVRMGVAGRAYIGWTDGPTTRMVEDFLWQHDDLTPFEGLHLECERTVSLAGFLVVKQRDTRHSELTDLSDVSEREGAIAAAVIALGRSELDQPGWSRATGNHLWETWGPAVLASCDDAPTPAP